MTALPPVDDCGDGTAALGSTLPGPETVGEGTPPKPLVETAPVTFTGRGSEYFRIWIVNVALTILTVGLFSAWAKVRRLQYFHRHTHLAGASFDYHGDPIAILKGRLIGGAMFAAYTTAGYISPFLALAAIAAIGCVMPWMLARSLRFRLRNTSYRGLRFGFSGSTRGAYLVFFLLPVGVLCSLGLLGPLCHHRIKRYQYDHSSFGNVPFRMAAQTEHFYVAYVFAVIISFAMVAVLGGLLGGIIAAAGPGAVAGEAEGPSSMVVSMALMAILGVYVLGLLTVQAFLTARLRNVVWNGTTAGGLTFASTLKTRSVLWITFTNMVATIATLGLFWPFAQVRLTRYFAERISMHGVMDFSGVAAGEGAEEGALGDEVAGMFDFDIAF